MSEFESLYPFLYSDTSDLSAVLTQVRDSTVAKAQEIEELRRTVAARDGARLAECAQAAAAMQFLEGIGQAYDDEIAALKASLIE